jgi:hypothetical protein
MLDDMTWQKRDEVIARLGASTRAHDWQEWLAIGREWGMDEAQVKAAFDEANEWLLDAVSVNGNGLRDLAR